MTIVRRADIRATGKYLLEILEEEKSVCFSRFFDDSPEARHALVQGSLGFMDLSSATECDFNNLMQLGDVALSIAAAQLEDVGAVKRIELDSRLVNGARDYHIELTEAGELMLARGLKFRFRELDYSVNAASASRWLISRLEAARRDGRGSYSLLEIMVSGANHGQIIITDEWKNRYRLGTGTYAWAFEYSMSFHARRGTITPTRRIDGYSFPWRDFITSSYVMRRAPHIRHELWDIPIRISDRFVSRNGIQHVGRISTFG